MSRSPAEMVTESFYAWEMRGRGWHIADYPVSLEPPYRPFFLLPDLEHPSGPIDDGRRPTLLSSLVDAVVTLFKGNANSEVAPFEEAPPFPVLPAEQFVTLTVSVPPDFAAQADVLGKLLLALSTALEPLSFEIVGHGGEVSLTLTCGESDKAQVMETIAGYVPEATVTEGPDILMEAWHEDGESIVIDFGLSYEFFLPLQAVNSLKVDPYIPLVSALSQAGSNETACFQVLFERVRNPWERSIREAVSDGGNGSLFADAPEFVPSARDKTKTPLFAVVLRIAAQGTTKERAWSLARSMGGFLLQFARPGSNELVPLENDEYPDELHELALLARQSFRTGMILSLDELLGFVHLPDASVAHPALKRERKHTKALPDIAMGHRLVLGENIYRGISTRATLCTPDRLQHVHVIGASGTGKSTLLLNMIEQDMQHGEGVAVFDPHGDLIEDILSRIPEERVRDVVVFDPGDEDWIIGFNMLSAGSEAEKNLIASDLVGIFKRLATSWGDTMSAVLGNAVIAMLEHPKGGTLLDLRRFLLDDAWRRAFLAEIHDEEICFFWGKEYPLIGSRSIGPILTRLDAFLRPKLIRYMVGERRGNLDLARIMNEGKILLVKLSHGVIGEENAHLLGSLLVSKFHQLALARQQTAREDRRPYFLYLDEFQHFVTPSMASLLTESRKYGLGLTLAHQTLSQLHSSPVESAILGNIHTRIVFRVDHTDAVSLARGFASFEASDLQNLTRGEAVVRIGSAGNDFNLKTFPASKIEPDVVATRSVLVLEASRQAYARPRSALEEELRKAHATAQEAAPAEIPSTPLAQQEESDAAREILAVETPEAPPLAVKTSPPKSRPIPPPEPTPLGRGGQEHKYLQHLVKRLGEERGFRAVIEEQVTGGKVDIVLRKESLVIACEISITTNVDHEVENLKKCLASGFTQILFISPDAKRREKITKKLREMAQVVPIEFLAPEDIVAALERLDTVTPTHTTVRGYKVKVNRQVMSYEDVAERRSAVAQVIARSLSRAQKA